MTRHDHPKYAGDVIFLRNGVAKLAAGAVTYEHLAADVINRLATNTNVTNTLADRSVTPEKIVEVPAGRFFARKAASGAGSVQFLTVEEVKIELNYAASDVLFDDTDASLGATTVQEAIDELDTRIDAVEGSSEGVHVAETPPSTPTQGKLWWHTGQGKLKIYYVDVDSSQWVDAISL